MFPLTEFLGYETLKANSVVNALIEYNSLVEEVNEGEEAEIVLDRSPLYSESGGQVGDAGIIKSDSLRVEVTNTKKINDMIIPPTNHHFKRPLTRNKANTNKNKITAPTYAGASTIGCFPQYVGACSASSKARTGLAPNFLNAS